MAPPTADPRSPRPSGRCRPGTTPQTDIAVESPFVERSKADIAERGVDLGVQYELTWSCYRDKGPVCGPYDSCAFRLQAFRSAAVRDLSITASARRSTDAPFAVADGINWVVSDAHFHYRSAWGVRMDLGIQGDVSLVAASSSGLGAAAARALAAEGSNVVINGRDEAQLEETAATVEDVAAAGARVVTHAADLTDADACVALVEATVDEFGGLDHLVTNAGGPPSGPFLDTDDEDWYQAFDLLVMSAVRLVREAAPHLKRSEGTIVNMTSHSVKEAIDGLVLSNAVRMAVVGLEKTLSREFAPEVRVNTAMPGAHATDRMEYLVQSSVDRGEFDSYDESYESWTDDIPLGRMGDPDNFGRVVAFLSSEPASFINGAAVMVDGGTSRSNL